MPATIEPAVAGYLETALDSIADVEGDAHQELAEAIEEAILEVAEESEEGLEAVLGEPADFVAELRVASGFGPSAGRVPRRRFARLRESAEKRATSIGESTTYQWTAQLLGELQPAWWVARGYAVAFVLTFYLDWLVTPRWGRVLWFASIPMPRLLPGVLAVPTLLAFIVFSVQIGRRAFAGWRKGLVMFLNVVAVVGIIGLASSLEDRVRYDGQTFTDVHPAVVEPFSDISTQVPIVLVGPDGIYAEAFSLEDATRVWRDLAYQFDPEAIQVITPNGDVERFQTDSDLADFIRSELFGLPIFIDP